MLFRKPISRETGLSADGPAFVMRGEPAQTAASCRLANGSAPAHPAAGGTSRVLASSQAVVSRYERGRSASRSGTRRPSRLPGGLRRTRRRRSEGAAWVSGYASGVTRRGFSSLVTAERSQGGNVLRKKGLYGLGPSPESTHSGDAFPRLHLFPRFRHVCAGQAGIPR